MSSRNVETYRAGHAAFNQRDFAAMTGGYADGISWTDHPQGRTFRTPREFRDDFLPGWVAASHDIRITDARYTDAGQTVVCTFTAVGTHDGPFGPFPATGKQFALQLVPPIAARLQCRRNAPADSSSAPTTSRTNHDGHDRFRPQRRRQPDHTRPSTTPEEATK